MNGQTPESNVLPLVRPPIRQSIVVRQSVQRTFDTFVGKIGDWWPSVPFSNGQHRVVGVTFETERGGRVYETWDDGTEVEWGEVLEWSPPRRFVITWNVKGVPTEVEMRFEEDGDATRVDLEHRGWERLPEALLAEDCALPGGYLGGSFVKGWAIILGRFTATAEHEPGRDRQASDE